MPGETPSRAARPAAILIVDSPEANADLYYRTRFLAPDPIVFVETAEGRRVLLASDLEFGRARSQAEVDRVLRYALYARRAGRRRKDKGRPEPAEVVAAFLSDLGLRRLAVPARFPLRLADGLRARGIRLEPRSDPLFPERAVKRPSEVAAIREVVRATEEALAAAVAAIRRARIRRGRLVSRGSPLAAEDVRGVLHRALLDRGCVAERTIVAGGNRGVDPHDEGSGPLPADAPIILDVFPRSIRTRYFADMTRTVVRGRASPRLRAMHAAVREAQGIAFARIRDGAEGKAIHDAIRSRFRSGGFRTGRRGGRFEGFFHGTGHGVGLDIHEAPTISGVPCVLRAGNVVTVEPGLYYRGPGGVRIEDMVLVTRRGCETLTGFPKDLEA